MSVRTYVGYYGPSPTGYHFSHAISVEEAERKLRPLSDNTRVTDVIVTQETNIPRWVKTGSEYQQVYYCSTAWFSSRETTVSALREVLQCADKYSYSSTLTERAWERIRSNQWDRNAFATSEFSSIYLTT